MRRRRQGDLFGYARRRARRQPRVLMNVLDAGACNYREWKCPRCGHGEQVHHVQDPPVAYRRPCPKCPQPGREVDAYPVVETLRGGAGAER